MLRKRLPLVAILAAFTLLVAACGDDDDAATTTTPTTLVPPAGSGVTPVVACFVTDDVGVDDRSFNEAGWKGVTDAAELGYAVAGPILMESDDESDYQPNIEQCLAQGAEHIVTNGWKLGAATQQFAELHPEVTWTIVDFEYDPVIPNVRGLMYQTDQAAFAAGYMVAGMTESGIVGTYGGVNIPTVSIFMDGLARGVAHYNEVNDEDVKVLGWDVELQDGLFTGTFDPGDPLVRATCESLLDEGADIILPVGGAINNPCGTAIQDRNLDAAMVGVDTDAYFAMPQQYQDLWMVTILKAISLQVTRSIQADAEGTWAGGTIVGDLSNDGVGLSEFHSWDDEVPDDLREEVTQLLADIEAGVVKADYYDVG